MALTLEAEQRLEAVGLINFFDKSEASWQTLSKKAYDYVKGNFPPGSNVRPDDVAKALVPIVEVDADLRNELNASKLKQKFWIGYFVDLVIDRTWSFISEDGVNDEQAEDSL